MKTVETVDNLKCDHVNVRLDWINNTESEAPAMILIGKAEDVVITMSKKTIMVECIRCYDSVKRLTGKC